MEIKTLPVTIQQARAWYKTDILELKELALSLFDKEKLEGKDYKTITTYYDALCALDLDDTITSMPFCDLLPINRAASAMFKLMIIRRALNLDYEMSLTENPESSVVLYYVPSVMFIEKDCNQNRRSAFQDEGAEIIGSFKSNGKEYDIIGNLADPYFFMKNFQDMTDVEIGGKISSLSGILGCANEEIAKHFSKHFGVMMIEAVYGSLDDFEITKEVHIVAMQSKA